VKLRASTFGDYFDIDPQGKDLIVVFIRSTERDPIWLLLPHQLYRAKVTELLKQAPHGAVVEIVRINAKDIELVATKEETEWPISRA
jgi:hypothetical protein